jgi:hypothetical protein
MPWEMLRTAAYSPRLTAKEFSYLLTLKGCMYALDNDVQKGTLV